jgi:hypothetical protein
LNRQGAKVAKQDKFLSVFSWRSLRLGFGASAQPSGGSFLTSPQLSLSQRYAHSGTTIVAILPFTNRLQVLSSAICWPAKRDLPFG